jgi:GNAT acetyltransferase-like protein
MPPTPIPTPGFRPVKGLTPLSKSEMKLLAEQVPKTPFFVVTWAGLRRGMHRAFVAGGTTDPSAVIIQHASQPREPEYFGRDPEAGWALLSQIPGWDCVCGSTTDVALLEPILAREVPYPPRRLGDLFYTLEGPPKRFEHPAVRRLGLPDIPMLERAEPSVRGGGYATFEEMLTEGAAAAGVVDTKVVALALLTSDNGRYADIGVQTLEPWQRQGMSSAAVTLVAEEVQARGMVPIWSTGEHNLASQRVAEKVGFRPYGRGEYLVFDELRRQGGYLPG